MEFKVVCFIYVLVTTTASAQQSFQPDPATIALDSIQRLLANDELKCIPRLLCEKLAGGQPGQLRGINVDTQSLFTLLKYLGLEGSSKSPMLGMGEAILTGLSHKGDPYSCYTKYPSCPRDQVRLLYYLNNHRGGFFRGFSRPYYGKSTSSSESRIVNKNLFYLQQLGLAPEQQNEEINLSRPYKNSFPNRRPNNFDNDIINNNVQNYQDGLSFPYQQNSFENDPTTYYAENNKDSLSFPVRRPNNFENDLSVNYVQNHQDVFSFPNQRPNSNTLQNYQDSFSFSNRRPKNFNFQPARPTDRLPSRLQFPPNGEIDNNFGSKGLNFFPQPA